MSENNEVTLLITGYPGKSPTNGGLGWSTVSLVQTEGRRIIVDTGPFGSRGLLRERLAEQGLAPEDITDVFLTHSHHDHSVNWPLFEAANIYISDVELEWSLTVKAGRTPVAEFYMRELAKHERLVRVKNLQEVLPGVQVELVPGHTPGSLMVIVDSQRHKTIFVGDAAKNRAELQSRHAGASADESASKATIARIWERWQEHPGNVVVPGHDLPLVLDGEEIRYVGHRKTILRSSLGATLTATTDFDLSGV